MPFNPAKHKTWKDKLADLKAVMNGKETLDSILSPNPVYIVFISNNSTYQQSDNVMKTKEDHDEWVAGLPKDATVIYVERDSNCEPLGTDPELVMAPRLAENKAKAEAKDKAVMALSEEHEKRELTDEQKKERWWKRYGNKYKEKKLAKEPEPESEATWLRAEPGQFEVLDQITRHFTIG